MGIFPRIARLEEQVIKGRSVGDFILPGQNARHEEPQSTLSAKTCPQILPDDSFKSLGSLNHFELASSTTERKGFSRHSSVGYLDIRCYSEALRVHDALSHEGMDVPQRTSEKKSRRSSLPITYGLKLPSISLSTSSSQHRSLLYCTSEADLDTQPQLTQFSQVSKDSSAGQYNSRCSQGEASSAVWPKSVDTRCFEEEHDVMQIAAQLGVISKEEIQQHVPHPPSSWHQERQQVTSGMRDISLGRRKVTNLGSTGHQQATLSANYGVSLSVLVDLAKRVTPGSSIADVITTIIKPETAVNQNSRFLDVLPGKLTGPAKHYIICSHNTSIHSLVNALQLHFNLSRKDTTSSSYYSNSTSSSTKQENSECCLWMDMISGNQHCPVRPQDLKQMAAVIKGADQVLLALDQHAYVLSQAVAFYELMQSIHCHDNLRQNWKVTVLPLSWAWSDMKHAFCTMSLEKSVVGPRFDKDQISALIQGQIEAGVDGTPAALQIKVSHLDPPEERFKIRGCKKLVSFPQHILHLHSDHLDVSRRIIEVFKTNTKSPVDGRFPKCTRWVVHLDEEVLRVDPVDFEGSMMSNKPSTLALHSAATSSAASSHPPCHNNNGCNMDAANYASSRITRIAGCQRQAQHTNTSSGSKKKEEANAFIILELKGERELTGATSGLTANRLKERSRKEHIADATYHRAREEVMASGHIKFYRGTNTATGGVEEYSYCLVDNATMIPQQQQQHAQASNSGPPYFMDMTTAAREDQIVGRPYVGPAAASAVQHAVYQRHQW